MTRADDSPVPDFQARLRLDGRRFVVLGAGQGIGRQATHALAAAGARVFCVDLEADRATDIAEEVGGVAGSGDATRREDSQRLFDEAAAAFDGIDGVVDIIGMSRYESLLETDDESWDWHQGIVLRHAYYAMQIGGRMLTANGGGSMVFVASISGIDSAPSHAAYGAAKAGLMSLVRTAALEMAPAKIRVNAVAPGSVWTPRMHSFLGEAGRQRNADNAPLGRVAEPADIAGALLFFASDLSSYVTGQTLVVDGGVSVKFGYPMPEGV